MGGQPLSAQTLKSADDMHYDSLRYEGRVRSVVQPDPNAKTSAVKDSTKGSKGVVTAGLNGGPRMLRLTPPIVGAIQLNSIRTEGVRQPATTDAAIDALTRPLKPLGITYADALGRVVQSVAVQTTPQNKDVVTPTVYNAIGMSDEKRLAFVCNTTAGCTSGGGYVEGAAAKQQQFYTASSWSTNRVAGTTKPWAITEREAAPSLRIEEVGGVGESYQPGMGHTMRSTVRPNTSADPVRKWTANQAPATGGLASSSFYAVGTLYVQEQTDPNETVSRTYTDLAGREVLREVDLGATKVRTYSVYDNAGNLRYVIPPEGAKLVPATGTVSAAVITTITSTWATEYRYDGEGRELERIKPEEDPVTTVYDRLGRVVLRQDGVFRPLNKWLFTKYDDQGRAVLTGIYTETNTARAQSRLAMQAHLDAQTVFFETRTAPTSSLPHGYTNAAFPVLATTDQVWTVAYFDDYSFVAQNGLTATHSFASEFASPTPRTDGLVVDAFAKFDRTRGLATGGKTLVLDGGSTYLHTVTYYDKKGRGIQSRSTNAAGGVDAASTLYAFSGEVLQTITRHGGPTPLVLEDRVVYDAQGRAKETYSRIDGVETKTSELVYNELGTVVEKKLHHTGTAFLQHVDYEYDAQGRLIAVNNDKLDTSGPNGDDSQPDLFGMRLAYDALTGQAATQLGFAARYDGSVAAMLWRAAGDDPSGTTRTHGYGYLYDALGRVTSSKYARRTGTTTETWDWADRYSMPVATYDLNGNLKNLQQRGAAGVIDNITYGYGAGGNRLITATDAATLTDGLDFRKTFTGYPYQPTYYQYDRNGNMTWDPNKGFQIYYTFHNLPSKAERINDTGKRIEWVWSATGARLKKQVYSGGMLTEETVYAGPAVYQRTSSTAPLALDYLPSAEGRILREGSVWTREYHLSDHLGNVRVAFKAVGSSAQVVQRRHYYAYGLEMVSAGSGVDAGREQPFTYNGKELDEEHGLRWHHYGVRFYDAQLGRWHVMDPVDQFASPYVYVGGDPVNLVDPDGAQAISLWEKLAGELHFLRYDTRPSTIDGVSSGVDDANSIDDLSYVLSFSEKTLDFITGLSGGNSEVIKRTFEGTPEIRRATKMISVFRYWNIDDENTERGAWYTNTDRYSSNQAIKHLALPRGSNATGLSEFVIMPGTLFLWGKAANQADNLDVFTPLSTGGGYQIYTNRWAPMYRQNYTVMHQIRNILSRD